MKKLLLCGISCLYCLLASVQSVPAKIDSLFSTPGYLNGGVLVAENGKIIYQKSEGKADFESGKQLTNESSFQTASLSKIFTSTAVLQLVGRRKINLSDPIQKYFPDFPYPHVTILHLLTHSSGLPDAEIFDSILVFNSDTVVMNSGILPLLAFQQRPLHFAPGTKFEYCNLGYQLLALLVERVSKKEFGSYLSKYVFTPAGMKNSWLRNPSHPIKDSNLVKNNITYPMYSIAPQDVDGIAANKGNRFWQRMNYDNHTMGGTYGDQNIITTTGDLLKFNNAFFSGQLISQKLVDEALKPLVLSDGEPYTENNMALGGGGSSYGLGWELHIRNNEIVAGHAGYNRGILCQYYTNVTKNQTIILFDNTEGYGFVQKFLNVVAILNGQSVANVDLRKSVARNFGYDLVHGGASEALIHFNEMKLDTMHYVFSKQGMNNLGYDFLRNGYKEFALEIFKTNLILFPEDYNRYDSYADALAECGRKEDAILMYKKALALKPDNEESRVKMKNLIEK